MWHNLSLMVFFLLFVIFFFFKEWAIEYVLPPLPVSVRNTSSQERHFYYFMRWDTLKPTFENMTCSCCSRLLYQITFSSAVLGVDVMLNWYFNHLRRWLHSRPLVPIFLTPFYWNTCSMWFLTLHVISLLFGCFRSFSSTCAI